MRKFIVFLLLALTNSLKGQINKVDHFFASSPKAETLFNLFKTKLGLPIDWDFKVWGDFSSGAVTLGNVAFEFVYYKGVTKTTFEGIALEPKQTVEELKNILDQAKIAHDTIENNTYVTSNGKVSGWANMTLKGLAPDEAGLFICDYKEREKIALYRNKSSDSLKLINGGPLGIMFLKEIVLGSTNLSLHRQELAKLPGVRASKDNLYTFETGPSIRLANSITNGFEKIIIKVNSVKTAKKYLIEQNLLGNSSGNSVFIDIVATDGLIIELTDQ